MSMIQKATIGNKELRIYQDDCGDSPREWDNLGVMICWHKRYVLGDKHQFTNPEDFKEWLKQNKAVVLPLYMYDHSGIAISTNRNYPFNDPWDSGQIGWIYATHERLKKEYKTTRITTKMLEAVERTLMQEVETYNDFVQGNIYAFRVIERSTCDKCGEVQETTINSCGGFYGSNFEENGLLEHAGSEWKNVVLENVQ